MTSSEALSSKAGHQKLTSSEVLKIIRGSEDHQELKIIGSWKTEELQMLFKWWFNHVYHCRRLEECSNGYFKRTWRHWMLILWRTLKKDNCTKCTTTIFTTLFLCLLVQEQQLCLQRCSSILGMDLKLILHRKITKSGNKSLVIWSSFKRLFFDVLEINDVSFTPLYKGVKTWRIARLIYNKLQVAKLCWNYFSSKFT